MRHCSSDSKKTTWPMPSLAYIFTPEGDVLLISIVRYPSHDGSRGVTFTITPILAYVLLPVQSAKTLDGILKYSKDMARTKELGGIIQTGPLKSSNKSGFAFLGSIISFLPAPLKILNWSEILISYPTGK